MNANAELERLHPSSRASVPQGANGEEPAPNQFEDYRSLSTAAVGSVVVGLLSALALLDWMMLLFPVAGLAVGIYAVRSIRRRADELTGLHGRIAIDIADGKHYYTFDYDFRD